MPSDKLILMIGALSGFALFLYNIASTEGILFRPDGNGHNKFTLSVFKDYLLSPFQYNTFKFNTLWANFNYLTINEKINLLQLNWIATTLFGLSLSTLFIILKHIF
mgnify:CR=1 FL=1